MRVNVPVPRLKVRQKRINLTRRRVGTAVRNIGGKGASAIGKTPRYARKGVKAVAGVGMGVAHAVVKPVRSAGRRLARAGKALAT